MIRASANHPLPYQRPWTQAAGGERKGGAGSHTARVVSRELAGLSSDPEQYPSIYDMLERRPAAESAEAELERELRAELLREVSREQAARAARICAEPLAGAPRGDVLGGAAGGARPGSGAHAHAQLQRARAKCAATLLGCR